MHSCKATFPLSRTERGKKGRGASSAGREENQRKADDRLHAQRACGSFQAHGGGTKHLASSLMPKRSIELPMSLFPSWAQRRSIFLNDWPRISSTASPCYPAGNASRKRVYWSTEHLQWVRSILDSTISASTR